MVFFTHITSPRKITKTFPHTAILSQTLPPFFSLPLYPPTFAPNFKITDYQ